MQPVSSIRSAALESGVPEVDLPGSDPAPDRLVALAGAHNFRDIGGYATADGRVTRRGVVFRSDHLNELTDDDRRVIDGLGIKVVHDFRMASERERQPTKLSPGYETVLLMMSDLAGFDTSMIDLIRDALAGKRPLPPPDFWGSSYNDLLESGRPMFVTLFESMTCDDTRVPSLFHCTGGKDRTGLAGAMMQRLLGVDEATVIDDFLLTNLYRTPKRVDANREGFAKVGINVADALPLLGVSRSAVLSALSTLDTTYGGVERYLIEGGLDPARIDRFRLLMLG